jgi:hypothetical protein
MRGFGEVWMICLAACISFAATAAAGLTIGEHVDIVWIVQRGAGVLSVILVFFLELRTLLRLKGDPLWIDRTLQPWLMIMVILKIAALIAIAATGIILEPSAVIVISYAVVFAILFASHWVLLSNLQESPEGPQQMKRGVSWTWPKGAGQPSALSYSPPRGIDRLIEAVQRASTTKLKVARAGMLLAVLAVICGAGAAVGSIVGRTPQNKPSTSTTATSSSTSTSLSPPLVTTATALTASTTVKTIPPIPPWDGTCPPPPPQSEAKEPAVGTIIRLYDEESPLTPLEEGCVGHIYPHHFYKEFYATMTGINPQTQTPISFSVDSEHFGPVIFRWAAHSLIEELMAKVGPVGGVGRFPRYRAGTGEFYLVRTPHKRIYVLIRRLATEAFQELVPTVARAWEAKMSALKGWLLPSWPVNDPHGTKIFQLLSDDSSGRIEGTITLHVKSGLATSNGTRYPANPVKELSLAELEALALTA